MTISFRPQVHRLNTVAELVRAARLCDTPLVVNEECDKPRLRTIAFLIGCDVQASRAFGEVREIRVVADTRSVAKSLSGHPMHMDGSFEARPPNSFLLYFQETDPAGGGVSEFLPVADVLTHLERTDFHALTTQPVRFARKDDDGAVDCWEGMLLGHDQSGELTFRWRYDHEVRPVPVYSEAGELSVAIEHLRQLIETLPRVKFAAKQHDLVWVPNRTWLHGRTALTPGSSRLVYRTWIH